MRRINSSWNIILAFTCVFVLQSCGNRQSKKKIQNEKKLEVLQDENESFVYNFYIENSGSVKGYFKGNTNNAEVIIKEFYDRIDERLKSDEKITLNYINNQIIPQKENIDEWLNGTYANCNAAFSDLDVVLEQILQNTDDKTVNFVVSDYCFESRDGNLGKAQSGITNIFTKALDKNNDLSVIIYKYEAAFDGYYFPGKIKFVGSRPLYIWIFGPRTALKKISNLNTEQEREDEMYIQSHRSFVAQVQTNNKRMTNRERSCIYIKHWRCNRNESDLYKVDVKVSMKDIMLPVSAIQNIDNYSMIPVGYYVDNIQNIADDEYIFTIATKHPSPCTLNIYYKLDIPNWVEMSNDKGNTLPQDSTTYGIKNLIEGVTNAYRNQNANVFDISLLIEYKE